MAKFYAGSYERFLFGFDVGVQDNGSVLVRPLVHEPVEDAGPTIDGRGLELTKGNEGRCGGCCVVLSIP